MKQGGGADDSAAFDPPLRRATLQLYRWLEGEGPRPTYWWVRAAILRTLGLVYLAAFVGAVTELVPLIGEHGLLPASRWLEAHVQHYGSRGEAMRQLPTLFWLDASDGALVFVAATGALLSLAVVLGVTQGGVMLLLWALYLSIDHVGQRWYQFGWESQLLETGLLAVFLCPWRTLRPSPPGHPPPRVVIVLMRWLAFRIMLGAGLIKVRGDACWRELTCLHTHFETQPIPGPLSAFFHELPGVVLQAGVAFNHLVELIVPLCVFGPRRVRLAAGVLLVAFQGFLIVSGNLAFLNWLTIVPCLACFDDRFLVRLAPSRLRAAFDRLRERPDLATRPPRVARGLAWAYAAIVAWLSMPVVMNLVGVAGRQSMNRSYDRLHIVNTYGAFGSVGRRRFELEIQGTLDDPTRPDADWRAYDLPCKPGDPQRRPCWITPYHRRLDWLMWFAALEAASTHQLAREGWVLNLVYAVLAGNRSVTALLAPGPFGDQPPRAVRVLLFEYEFAPRGDEAWWTRRELGVLVRPVTRDDPGLRAAIVELGMKPADPAPAR